MRKFLTLFVFAILLLPAPVQALPPVTISNQGILGGYMIDLEGVSNNSTVLSAGGDMTGIQVSVYGHLVYQLCRFGACLDGCIGK